MNKAMRKMMIFTTAALSAAIMSACGSSEITGSIYVSSMGFSKTDGMYTVTVFGETVNDDGDIEKISASGRGADPAAAIGDAGENCGRSVFYGHCTAMALDRTAVTDKNFYHSFTDSVISPACMIYYSEDPGTDAENIPAHGFSEKLFRAASECLGDKPITLPCASDGYKAAVITVNGVQVLGHDDSYGLMLLSGKEYPTTLTEKNKDGEFYSVRIDPKVSRKGKMNGGRTVLELTITPFHGNADPESSDAAKRYIRRVCLSAFEKTVLSGTDAPGTERLAGTENSDLRSSALIVNLK